MKMQAKILALASIVASAGIVSGQAYLAESNAAASMNNTISGGPGGPPPMPGAVPGVGNPSAGFNPSAPGGNTAPGGYDPAINPDLAGVGGGAYNGQPGVVYTPAATPIPTENVLVGRRVYDAVSGALLEDAIEIAVRKSDVDVYPDDGVSDNGIAGDGIRGNVVTSNKQYIGQFSNTAKDRIVHGIRNAENISPLVYYGYHVAKLDARSEGLKRYGKPLPGAGDEILDLKPVADHPNFLDLEDDRDELVRQWNQDFLARYRVTPEDPRSEFYPIFVPSPPLTPVNYPVPNGYITPQSLAISSIESAEQAQSAAAEAGSAALQGSRGGDGGGDAALGGGI